MHVGGFRFLHNFVFWVNFELLRMVDLDIQLLKVTFTLKLNAKQLPKFSAN